MTARFPILPLLTLAMMVWALLAGCASNPAGRAPADPLVALEQRATARWQHLIADQFAEAYAFFSPGYRSTRSLEGYASGARSAALRWDGIEWQEARCANEDSCTAILLLTYSVRMPGAGDVPGVRQVEEQWVRLDGTWYHVPER
ncbi:MAG: hypothetical protein KF823_07580 [Xanthomonadales bacterium]|nr:hypothetical protein [Xanthomonadales bacterium]